MTIQKISKILIIRMSSIGDIILTTPVIRQLRERFPDAQIDYLIRDSFAEILSADPQISNLIPLNIRDNSAVSAMRKQIKSEKYDIIFDLHGNLRSKRLTAFLSKTKVFNINKNKVLRHLLVNYKINLYKKFVGKSKSVVEKYLESGIPIGLDPKDQKTTLFINKDVSKRIDEIWQKLASENYKIVIAPGARHFTKRWLPENYASLIQKIHKTYNYKSILLGGKDEADICNSIQQAAGSKIVKNFAGKLKLSESIALISHSPLFISNDSGLMHVAAAFNVPQLAFFGSTIREFGFAPINAKAKILELPNLPCRPCSHIGKSQCPKSHFLCMRSISPEMALDEIKNWVNNINPAAVNE